jgi:hypothetical protein
LFLGLIQFSLHSLSALLDTLIIRIVYGGVILQVCGDRTVFSVVRRCMSSIRHKAGILIGRTPHTKGANGNTDSGRKVKRQQYHDGIPSSIFIGCKVVEPETLDV